MIITRLYLENFKCFREPVGYKFNKLTLVQGENGAGKSTIVVDALMFVLYGYYYQALDRIPTRGKATWCKVRVELSHNGKQYIIERKYPTQLTIIEDGIEIVLQHNADKQEYLNKLFKNIDYFRKFRMIDNSLGINILEQGKLALKKTLLTFSEDTFNTVREDLLRKKKVKEDYNISKVVYPHYPSEYRLNVLQHGKAFLQEEMKKLTSTLQVVWNDIRNYSSDKKTLESQINFFEAQEQQLLSEDTCPLCSQPISGERHKCVLTEVQQKIADFKIKLEPLLDIVNQAEQYQQGLDIDRQHLSNKIATVEHFIHKLNTRIKQKDYKYTLQDVEILKKSIEELDKFYNHYISEWIGILEPIINSIIDKLGLRITFTPQFDFQIYRGDVPYSYKDLSSGQRLVISLAFKLALLLERNEEGIIIADEGFSSLDTTNLEYVIKVFKDLPFQLVAIIHRYENNNENVEVISL